MTAIQPGKKYELLTPREKLPDKIRKEEAWLCDCDCGEQTTATKSQLLHGLKKSCGCLRKETPANALDLTNQRFGKLKAIERAGTNERGQALWLCECDCGNKKSFTATILRRGEATSCGCARPEQGQLLRRIMDTEKTIDGVQVPLLKRKVRSDSGTGYKGVHRRVRKGKEYFEAHISVKGKRIWGSPRTSLEEAIADRKALEKQYHSPYIEALEEKERGQGMD